MRLLTLSVVTLAFGCGMAFATPAHADEAYDACMEKAVTNPDYSQCGAALVNRREAELNKVWKEVYKDLDPGVKAALLDEQRAWVAYKDKSCSYWSTGYYGREGQVISFYSCRGDVIDARIDYLENLGDPGEPEDTSNAM